MRSIVVLVAVAVVSLLAGIAVTGLPKDVPDDVRSNDISATTAAPATTTEAPQVTTAPAEGLAASTAPQATDATTTTTTNNTTTTATTTTLVPTSSLRVIVANAGAASGVAARVAADLRSRGYGDVSSTDAITARPDTIVVFAPGFEQSAALVAADLGFAAPGLEPQGASALTADGAPADVWILVGQDQS